MWDWSFFTTACKPSMIYRRTIQVWTDREIDVCIILEKKLLVQGPRWILFESSKESFV